MGAGISYLIKKDRAPGRGLFVFLIDYFTDTSTITLDEIIGNCSTKYVYFVVESIFRSRKYIFIVVESIFRSAKYKP